MFLSYIIWFHESNETDTLS